MSKNPLQHVLYVDDEPDMRMLVQMTLENMGGIKVTVCDSGLHALEAAHDTQPQMIVLDAMMPDMDGPSILKEIQGDPKIAAIPVIFLTAKTDPEAISALKAAGAKGVINKPFDLVALPDQIRKLWESAI